MVKDKTIEAKRTLFLTKEWNKTSLYMTPALDFNRKNMGMEILRYYGFVNCFLDFEQCPIKKNPNYIYVVFNPSTEALKSFSDFYNTYSKYSNFVDDFIIDYNLIVLVFSIKDKWKTAFEYFKKSQYSKMGKDYSDMFVKIDNVGKKTVDKQYYVILKHKDLKLKIEKELAVKISDDAELASPLEFEKETFNYARITKI